MTFETREISNQDGAPVALYEFRWGDTLWRYTSSVEDQTITTDEGDVTYTAVAISDNGMVQGGSSNNNLEVTVQSDIELIDLFRSTPPSGPIMLTVRRLHNEGGSDEWFVYWLGQISNVKRQPGGAKAVIVCHTILATFDRTGLRLSWTRGCPHMLYDSECRVDPSAFAVSATITAKNSDGSISVDTSGGNPAGYFDGGYIEWPATEDGTLDQRSIESSASDTTFVIFGSADRLEVGMTVTLYPGCPLIAQACNDKFNNLANFGGFEQMTDENPFDGRNIF